MPRYLLLVPLLSVIALDASSGNYHPARGKHLQAYITPKDSTKNNAAKDTTADEDKPVRKYEIGLDGASDQSHYGLRNNVKVPYLEPNFTYKAKSGFYIETGDKYILLKKGGGFDEFNLNPGWNFGLSDNTTLNFNYTFYHFKPGSSVLIKSGLFSTFEGYIDQYIGNLDGTLTVDYDIYKGKKTPNDVAITPDISYDFELDFGKKSSPTFIPGVNMDFGTRNFYTVYLNAAANDSISKNLKPIKKSYSATSNSSFGILDYNLILSLEYKVGKFSVEPAITYTHPEYNTSNLSNSKPFAYGSITMVYTKNRKDSRGFVPLQHSLVYRRLKDFPLSKQIIYATGMMGWSIMMNLIGVMLVYFYLPPNGEGLHNLVSQRTFLGIFNILAIILASGRMVDAIYDPFIARMSDKSQNKRGRRIPFMLFSTVPAVVCCILVFYPPVQNVSRSNALWLILPLTLFFVTTTTYAIPYNAMLPELAKTNIEKVRLSSFQQVGFVFGMIIASLTNNIADGMKTIFQLTERTTCIQYSVIFLAVLGGILMFIPALFINEKKYCHSVPSSTPLFKALKESFNNPNFFFFIAACLAYFMSINLILNGLLYFVTVLAHIPETEGPKLIGFMVLLSLIFYPPVNYLVKRLGEKKMMLFSFFLLSFVFIGISSIGKLSIDPKLELYLLLGLAAFPLASLGILPNAILAEIISDDVKKTGDNKEGIYVAVNFFSTKLGQTFGIALFAMLTVYGKDPGHDMGLRLTGVSGAVLCTISGFIFFGFKNRPK